MADLTELFEEYMGLIVEIKENQTKLKSLKRELPELEKSFGDAISQTIQSRMEEVNGQMADLSKVSELAKSGKFNEAYSLLTGLTYESEKLVKIYEFMPITDTYALGVHALRRECEKENNQYHPKFKIDEKTKIYRSLTFEENMRAGVEDFNILEDENRRKRTIDERLHLFNTNWRDSCSGAAYEKNSPKFKIIPVCRELITIDEDFKKPYLPVVYSDMEGEELDSSRGNYNVGLPKSKVLENPAWRVSVPDKNLLNEAVNIVYSHLKRDSAMGFYLEQDVSEDKLRHLYVYRLGDDSNADAGIDLDYNGCFLRVAHAKFFHRK